MPGQSNFSTTNFTNHFPFYFLHKHSVCDICICLQVMVRERLSGQSGNGDHSSSGCIGMSEPQDSHHLKELTKLKEALTHRDNEISILPNVPCVGKVTTSSNPTNMFQILCQHVRLCVVQTGDHCRLSIAVTLTHSQGSNSISVDRVNEQSVFIRHSTNNLSYSATTWYSKRAILFIHNNHTDKNLTYENER